MGSEDDCTLELGNEASRARLLMNRSCTLRCRIALDHCPLSLTISS